MNQLIPIYRNQLSKLLLHRNGEIKLGERVALLDPNVSVDEALQTSNASFVLFGIPECVGVVANYGKKGTETAWYEALTSIANVQHNKYCKGQQLLILGAINTKNWQDEMDQLDVLNTEHRLRMNELVQEIDKEVSHLVYTIIKNNKIPIIIGGGHNNAYGAIKGLALAKGKPVNAINFDAHTDFRILEGRHSGNAFSYALEEGFLNRYFAFGIHESYTPKHVFETIKKFSNQIKYTTYEQIAIRREKTFEHEIARASQFITNDFFGLDIDIDALPNMPSSAMTNCGFSVETLRQFVHHFGFYENAAYLHICEAAPNRETYDAPLLGKLMAAIVTDFMKAKQPMLSKSII